MIRICLPLLNIWAIYHYEMALSAFSLFNKSPSFDQTGTDTSLVETIFWV